MKRTPEAAASSEAVGVSPAMQAALSVVLLIHLLAVVATPLLFASRTSPGVTSPAADLIERPLRPYIQALYLNHGYAFFAPEPGPSHLVRYELEFDDGREPIVGEFPDRNQQWPRLLYHRHFMLSESLFNAYVSPRSPEEPPRPQDDSPRSRRQYQRDRESWKEMHANWEAGRMAYEAVRTSFIGHLKHFTGASEVTLIQREHRQPTPDEFLQDRILLNDEELKRPLIDAPSAEPLPWNPPSR